MRTVEFQIEKLKFSAIFDLIVIWDDGREITTCTLVAYPERAIYAGAAICHPRDIYSTEQGENLAFERAVQAYLSLRGLTELLQHFNKPKEIVAIQKCSLTKCERPDTSNILRRIVRQMKTRTVQPCGILSTNGLVEYFLLSPTPVVRDSWQDDCTHRFVGVPMLDDPMMEDGVEIFPYARHIVSNAFAIEYVADMERIQIEVLEDVDVTYTEPCAVKDEEIQDMLGDDE